MEKRTAENAADSVKTYEVAVLLTPLLPEEKAAETFEALITGPLAKAGGAVKSGGEAPKMITLAYPIKKVVEHKSNIFRQAYFGWVRFESTAAFAVELSDSFKKSSEVVRSLIINLPKDAFREAPKRVRRPDAAATPEPAGETTGEKPEAPLDEAALDNKIDELLVTPQA